MQFIHVLLYFFFPGKVTRAKKAFIKAFRLAEETDDDVTKDMIKDSMLKLDINIGHG